MDTETVDATPQDVNLDEFSAELFGTEPPKPVQEDAQVDEGADDTSPSDADDTKPEDTPTDADPNSNEGDEAPTEESEKPKKKTAAERIAEIVAERNAERDRAIALQARLDAIEAAKATPVETSTPAATNELVAPDPDELLEDGVTLKYPLGEYDQQYLADRVDYLFADREAKAEAKRRESEEVNSVNAARTELQQNWETKLQAAEAGDMKDIREAGAVLVSELQEVVTPEYGDYLATTIMRMEQGPEVFYFLANNPEVARVIAAQDATNATIALGALQERFRFMKENAENGNPKPRQSNAPEPPAHVNRGSSGRFEVPDDTEDLDAFAKKLGLVNGRMTK